VSVFPSFREYNSPRISKITSELLLGHNTIRSCGTKRIIDRIAICPTNQYLIRRARARTCIAAPRKSREFSVSSRPSAMICQLLTAQRCIAVHAEHVADLPAGPERGGEGGDLRRPELMSDRRSRLESIRTHSRISSRYIINRSFWGKANRRGESRMP